VVKNTILDVGGLHIGQAHDARVKTGVTVILPDAPATCAVDIRGGGQTLSNSARRAQALAQQQGFIRAG